MPIPFLFIAAVAGATALGVGKTIKAGSDQKKANETNERANQIVEDANARIEKCSKDCSKAIDNLNYRRILILNESIQPFITEFEKLNHVELTGTKGLDEFSEIVLNPKQFDELKELQSVASTVIITSGLSMGIAAGPLVAVYGFLAGAKASINKDKAYSNLAKAKEYRDEMDAAAKLCMGIRRRSNMLNRFLLTLNSIFEPLIYEMRTIIKKRGKDFRKFKEEEKNTVAEAMALAGAIKAILDTPILDDDGNLAVESEIIVDEMRKELKTIL